MTVRRSPQHPLVRPIAAALLLLLLTFVIRVLFFPLTYKSQMTMQRMQDLKPQITALQHKYKAKVPAADDTILAGDRVVVMVKNDQEKALIKSLI